MQKFSVKLSSVLALLFILSAYSHADNASVYVSKIYITGNKVLVDSDLRPLIARYEGADATLADLNVAAASITKAYKDKGYILALAYIPEQKVPGGVVEIAVIEGKTGDIRIEGENPYYSDEFIKGYFDPVIEEEAYNQKSIERPVLLLNELPRLNVKVMLEEGRLPGTADIVVEIDK